MPNEPHPDWLDAEDEDLGLFLSYLDTEMENNPELIQPADEAQLMHLEKLLANVKV